MLRPLIAPLQLLSRWKEQQAFQRRWTCHSFGYRTLLKHWLFIVILSGFLLLSYQTFGKSVSRFDSYSVFVAASSKGSLSHNNAKLKNSIKKMFIRARKSWTLDPLNVDNTTVSKCFSNKMEGTPKGDIETKETSLTQVTTEMEKEDLPGENKLRMTAAQTRIQSLGSTIGSLNETSWRTTNPWSFKIGQMVEIFSCKNIPEGSLCKIVGWAENYERWIVRLGDGKVMAPPMNKMRPMVHFEPTLEWQIVCPGAVIPAGLDVRMQLGINDTACEVWARLHGEDDNDCQNETSTIMTWRRNIEQLRAARSRRETERLEAEKQHGEDEVELNAEERFCRICFEGDDAGALVSPCKCIGTQKFVHLNCIHLSQLVPQSWDPDRYLVNDRQRLCTVCKSEFACAPPTRAEFLAWAAQKYLERNNGNRTAAAFEAAIAGNPAAVNGVMIDVSDVQREVAVHALRSMLQTNRSWQVRRNAAIALGEAALPGDQATVAALVVSLGALVDDVRCAAAESLGKVALRGDQIIIDCLAARLGDQSEMVRLAAARSFGKLGNQSTISVLMACHDADDVALAEAVHGLMIVVSNEQRQATVDLLISLLETNRWETRKNAVVALGEAALPGDQVTFAALNASLGAVVHHVRRAAAESLGKVALRGDKGTIDALVTCLGDQSETVRLAAVTWLGRITLRGDQAVVSALLTCLDDPNADVKRAVTEALSRVQLMLPAPGVFPYG